MRPEHEPGRQPDKSGPGAKTISVAAFEQAVLSQAGLAAAPPPELSEGRQRVQQTSPAAALAARQLI